MIEAIEAMSEATSETMAEASALPIWVKGKTSDSPFRLRKKALLPSSWAEGMALLPSSRLLVPPFCLEEKALLPLSWPGSEVPVWGVEKGKTGPYLFGFSLKIAEKH